VHTGGDDGLPDEVEPHGGVRRDRELVSQIGALRHPFLHHQSDPVLAAPAGERRHHPVQLVEPVLVVDQREAPPGHPEGVLEHDPPALGHDRPGTAHGLREIVEVLARPPDGLAQAQIGRQAPAVDLAVDRFRDRRRRRGQLQPTPAGQLFLGRGHAVRQQVAAVARHHGQRGQRGRVGQRLLGDGARGLGGPGGGDHGALAETEGPQVVDEPRIRWRLHHHVVALAGQAQRQLVQPGHGGVGGSPGRSGQTDLTRGPLPLDVEVSDVDKCGVRVARQCRLEPPRERFHAGRP
jgi:hypothetical protein